MLNDDTLKALLEGIIYIAPEPVNLDGIVKVLDGEDRERVIGEAADVLYHLLVVLHARGITLAEVEAELGARTQQSGLDEKAARKSG